MKQTVKLLPIMACGLVLTTQPCTHAGELRLSDGVNTVIVADDGPLDSDPTPGRINYVGGVGTNWFMDLNVGITKPFEGGPLTPFMDLNSDDFSSSGAGTLTVEFTDTSFLDGGFVSTAIGGRTPGNVRYQTWADLGNNPFGKTTALTDSGIMVGPLFTNAASATFFQTGPYSLTLVATINHPTKGGNTGFDAEISITSAPPVITCAAPLTLDCAAGVPAPDVTSVSASGSCPPVIVTFVGDVITSSNCPNQFTLTRTYMATDACGNSATCSQTISVQDQAGPTFLNVPPGGNLGCNPTTVPGDADVQKLVSAVDNCPGQVAVYVSHQDSGTPCALSRSFTILAVDSCNNTSTAPAVVYTWRADSNGPQLTGCPPNASYQCLSAVPGPANVTANDDCDGPVNVNLVQSTNGTPCNMTITRTWMASDSCGNLSSCSQTILVQDTTGPTLTGVPGGGNLGCSPANLPTDASVKGLVGGTDNCAGPVAIYVSHVDSGTPCAMTRTFTIFGVDSCNNTTAVPAVVYTWKADTTGPQLTGCPSNATYDCLSGVPAPANVTANDACDGPVQVNLLQSTNGTVCNLTITRVWTASDSCGNSSSCTQIITVQNTTPPVITCSPDKAVACGQAWTFDKPTAMGNCGPATVTVLTTVTNAGPNNTLIATRTWVATDACGNSAQCSQNVTMQLCPSGPYAGCTPGFWKNHPQIWDGSTTTLPSITYRTTMSFNAVFGVTPAQSGMANSVTLLQAAGTGGGGLIALGRQVVAALLNTQSQNYPLSLSTVILRYRVAVGALACPPIPAGLTQCDTVDGLESELDTDNNLEGVLCNGTYVGPASGNGNKSHQ